MSMSDEHAAEFKNEVAVVCCRTEAGTIITAANLEDPSIFPDLVDSGLLTIPENCLKIGQVIGAKLTKTIDSLFPLTPEIVEGVIAIAEDVKVADSVDSTPEAPNMVEGVVEETPAMSTVMSGGILKIKIAEGKGIDIEIPLNSFNQNTTQAVEIATAGMAVAKETIKEDKASQVKFEDKIVRELVKKHFKIEEVKFGPETKIEGTVLYIRENICIDAVKVSELVTDIKIDIITPDKYNTYSETIMDVQAIATKEGEHKLGQGITRVLDGVIVMVTGTDENGVQIGEFGSSEGILEENIMWGRPGAPDKGEIFIKTQVTILAGTNMERPGPFAAHKATDRITQEIREALKTLDESLVVDSEKFTQFRRPGKNKIVVVKEIMGQGAMHDNLILPVEPIGILGGKPNVDLGNLPIVFSPLEVLDGGIHALTCIGPASKECSRHYWREPLVIAAMNDPEVDLCGVVFVGSPQINSEKFYVSERLGMTVETMDVAGAIVTTEGFGNNHIDFASHIEQIGMRGIGVVGMSFCGVQGALVVGNKYTKYMVDNNKSEAGIENEVLGCNTLCREDALRALSMLKTAIAGEEVVAAERHWNPNVKDSNIEAIEKSYAISIDRVENETSIPESKKRLEKYSSK